MGARRNYSNTANPTYPTVPLTGSSTSMTLAALSGYPQPPFTIRIGNEIILVGEVSGTQFKTLTRGYDGSVALPHSTGEQVTHVAIADDFRYRWQDVIVNDDSVTAYDDEFDDEDMSGWVQVTPTGTASWKETRGVMSARYHTQTASDCAALLHSLDGLSYPLYIVTAVRSFSFNQNFNRRGLVFSQGTTTTSPCIWMMPYASLNTYTNTLSLGSGTFTNVSTTHYAYTHYQPIWGGWLYQRLDWIATNLFRAWYSVDGISWTDLGQGTFTPAISPTHYGLGVSTWGGTGVSMSTFDFFRTYTTTSKPSYWQES